jgi:hypothetical protein
MVGSVRGEYELVISLELNFAFSSLERTGHMVHFILVCSPPHRLSMRRAVVCCKRFSASLTLALKQHGPSDEIRKA